MNFMCPSLYVSAMAKAHFEVRLAWEAWVAMGSLRVEDM